MKGKLIISSYDEEEHYFKTNVSKDIDPYDFKIEIRVPLEGSFEEVISKPYDFDECIDFNISTVADDIEYIDFFKQIKNNRLQYIKNINDIIFYYHPKEIAEFVKRNPILKTKRIIFEDYFDLDPQLVNQVYEAFGNETSNIFFKIHGNDNLITFQEYKDTIFAINQRINDIEKFDFSPLEKIMYVYDMVRDKVYSEVNENEDKMISRNLSSALLGDKIVCVGYAKIFQTLLEKLGIECKTVILTQPNKKNGHARNVIFIKDDKYDVEGVYYFDTTWDNKKNEFDNDFIYSYKYFAMTKERMDIFDNGFIVEKAFPYYSKDITEEFIEQVDLVGFEGLSEKMIRIINHMAHLTNNESLINKIGFLPNVPEIFKPNKEKIVEKLGEITQYFDKTISADTLLKVLFNVRKQQYYTNPDKYPFGLNEFCKTLFMSGWNFNNDLLDTLILELASSQKERDRIRISQAAEYINESDMHKQIEQVKLTKTLRKIYEQKVQKK